jgi:hypothetical protein
MTPTDDRRGLIRVGDAVSRRYWDEQLETLPRERRRELRDHRLRWQVRRCFDGSPFYRRRFETAGLAPATFGGLDDLHRIPILYLPDLPRDPRVGEPSRDWTVAPEVWWRERERPDGGPVRVLTDGDLTHRAHLAARAMWASGEWSDRSLAAMPATPPGGTAFGTPHVSTAIAYACGEADGLHWNDDHFLVESVDPETGQLADPGTVGALVITDLTREGSPLIRFRTDLEVAPIAEPCPCGRTSARSAFARPLSPSTESSTG